LFFLQVKVKYLQFNYTPTLRSDQVKVIFFLKHILSTEVEMSKNFSCWAT